MLFILTNFLRKGIAANVRNKVDADNKKLSSAAFSMQAKSG